MLFITFLRVLSPTSDLFIEFHIHGVGYITYVCRQVNRSQWAAWAWRWRRATCSSCYCRTPRGSSSSSWPSSPASSESYSTRTSTPKLTYSKEVRSFLIKKSYLLIAPNFCKKNHGRLLIYRNRYAAHMAISRIACFSKRVHAICAYWGARTEKLEYCCRKRVEGRSMLSKLVKEASSSLYNLHNNLSTL